MDRWTATNLKHLKQPLIEIDWNEIECTNWRLAAGRWFSTGAPVSSTKETDRHDLKHQVKHHNPNPQYGSM
jgi:hypothetical protein